MSCKEYIDHISTPGNPFDLLGLFLISQLYEFHIAIMFKSGFWCTAASNRIKDCMFVLIFNDVSSFLETCQVSSSLSYTQSLVDKTNEGHMPSQYKAAINLVVKARKDRENLDSKWKLQNIIKQTIQSGNLRPADIAEKAHSIRKMRAVTCEICSKQCHSLREFMSHMKDDHPSVHGVGGTNMNEHTTVAQLR